MARNLTGQVSNIAAVTTAVAKRRLVQKINGGCIGRKFSIERYVQYDGGSARSFASEVTRVAREVGTEGKTRRLKRR